MDDDSGLGNDNDWQIRPVAVDPTGSEVCCIKNIAEFKRTRAIFPVVKIKWDRDKKEVHNKQKQEDNVYISPSS